MCMPCTLSYMQLGGLQPAPERRTSLTAPVRVLMSYSTEWSPAGETRTRLMMPWRDKSPHAKRTYVSKFYILVRQ